MGFRFQVDEKLYIKIDDEKCNDLHTMISIRVHHAIFISATSDAGNRVSVDEIISL